MKNNKTKVGTVAFLVFVLLMLKQRRDRQRQSRHQWFVDAHASVVRQALGQLTPHHRKQVDGWNVTGTFFVDAMDNAIYDNVDDLSLQDRIEKMPPGDRGTLLAIINTNVQDILAQFGVQKYKPLNMQDVNREMHKTMERRKKLLQSDSDGDGSNDDMGFSLFD